MGWLSGNQLHRFEGIFIYFGFLLVLFMVSEKTTASISQTDSISKNASSLFRLSIFPLLIYYATALGIPLVNGAYRSGSAAGFWEHSVFVLLTPLLLILPILALQLCRCRNRNQNGWWENPFNQPAKLADRVVAPGDGLAEPGEREPKCDLAHESGRQMRRGNERAHLDFV
jgi:uncharacterized membrane protein YhaH (DUF805 family)